MNCGGACRSASSGAIAQAAWRRLSIRLSQLAISFQLADIGDANAVAITIPSNNFPCPPTLRVRRFRRRAVWPSPGPVAASRKLDECPVDHRERTGSVFGSNLSMRFNAVVVRALSAGETTLTATFFESTPQRISLKAKKTALKHRCSKTSAHESHSTPSMSLSIAFRSSSAHCTARARAYQTVAQSGSRRLGKTALRRPTQTSLPPSPSLFTIVCPRGDTLPGWLAPTTCPES